MLSKLLKQASEKGFFEFSTICDLHKPCMGKTDCSKGREIKVIDFDKTAGILTSTKSLQTYSSTDGLLLCPVKKKAYFIEIKGWQKYIEYNKMPTKANLKQKLDGYDLEAKFKDSLDLLKLLIDSCEIHLNLAERKEYYSLDNYFVLVTDIEPNKNSIGYIYSALSLLACASSDNIVDKCYNATEERIEVFDPSKYGIITVNKPILLQCKEFDAFMKSQM